MNHPGESSRQYVSAAAGGFAAGTYSGNQYIIHGSRGSIRGIGAVLVLALLGLASWQTWAWYERTRADVSLMRVPDVVRTRAMAAGATETVTIVGQRPRVFLRLAFHLHNPDAVGNCVAPASLKVLPKVGGRPLVEHTFVSDEVREIALPAGVVDLTLHLALIVPDSRCRLELTVSDALLHN